MFEFFLIIFLEFVYIFLIDHTLPADFDKFFIGMSLIDTKNPYKYLFFSKKYQTKTSVYIYCYLTLNLSLEPKKKLEFFFFNICDIVFYPNLKNIINFYLERNHTVFVNLIFYTVDLDGNNIVFSVNNIFNRVQQPYEDLKNQITYESESYLTKDLLKYEIHIKIIDKIFS
jgi:hypothetical protein